MKTLLPLLFLLFYVPLSGSLFSQDTLRVPQDFANIQTALDSANQNDFILVSPGVYTENLVYRHNLYGIKLIGTAGCDSTIIDGNQAGRVIDKYTFLDDPGSIIQGFTIRNGAVPEKGGGIYLDGKGTMLKDLIISNNKVTDYSSFGAGARLAGYSGIIDNCIFRNNDNQSLQGASGGGLFIGVQGQVEILNSTFSGNKAGSTNVNTNSGIGGGLYVSMGETGEILIRNCRISGNRTIDNSNTKGAGLYVSGGKVVLDSCLISGNTCEYATNSFGGGIYSTATDFTIMNSTILGNTSREGSAIMMEDNDMSSINTIRNTDIESNQGNTAIELRTKKSMLDIRNCRMTDNDALAVFINNPSLPASTLNMNHCTIAGNYYGGISSKNARINISNSILWNGLNQFTFTGWHQEKVQSCIVRLGFPGGGNNDLDPLLDDQFIPGKGSPCLSAANPALAEALDMKGNIRPLPTNSLPDIGAIEVNQSLQYVTVKFYHDLNENGIKETEERYSQLGAVRFQNENTYVNFRKEGMIISVQPGTATFGYDENFNDQWKVTSQQTFNFNIDTNEFAQAIEFGIAPKTNDIVVGTYIHATPFRCGEQVEMNVTVSNEFAPIIDEIVWFMLDDRVENYVFSIPPDTTSGQHLIGWFIDELYPGESISFEGYVTAPMIGGGIHLGDKFIFKSWVATEEVQSMFSLEAELRCSFDPNDKQVNPNRPDSLALISSPLFYTIRFQNTGNDYAQHVSITDTLDSSLDLRTFKLIHTSHPDFLEVIFEPGNIVRFQFNNIFLLDSTTNFVESNGHVSYTIIPHPETEQMTHIRNNAAIYFDSNPHIKTNTATSIMVNEFIVNQNFPTVGPFISINPNPSNGICQLSSLVEEAVLYTLDGEPIIAWKNVNQINIGHLPNGIYMLKILSDGHTEVHKLMLTE